MFVVFLSYVQIGDSRVPWIFDTFISEYMTSLTAENNLHIHCHGNVTSHIVTYKQLHLHVSFTLHLLYLNKMYIFVWSDSSWLFISVIPQPALNFLTSSHNSKHTHWINCICHLLLLERVFRCDSHYAGSTATFVAHCFCSPQVGMISDECIEWRICWNVFVDWNRM
jgi:hypothetical protein